MKRKRTILNELSKIYVRVKGEKRLIMGELTFFSKLLKGEFEILPPKSILLLLLNQQNPCFEGIKSHYIWGGEKDVVGFLKEHMQADQVGLLLKKWQNDFEKPRKIEKHS